MSEELVFDKKAVLDRVDNDLELFFELVDLFFEDYTSSMGAIKNAIDSSSAEEIEQRAHAIKSALGNIGAMTAFKISYELEKAGKENTLEPTAELLSALEQEVGLYRDEVNAFKEAS